MRCHAPTPCVIMPKTHSYEAILTCIQYSGRLPEDVQGDKSQVQIIPGNFFSKQKHWPTAHCLAPLMHAQTMPRLFTGTSLGILLCLLCSGFVRRRSSGTRREAKHHKQDPFLQRVSALISLLEEMSTTVNDSSTDSNRNGLCALSQRTCHSLAFARTMTHPSHMGEGQGV